VRFASVLLAISFAAVLLSGCGPRMTEQPSVKPYERAMPAMPKETVPTTGVVQTPTAEQVNGLSNPVAPTPENRQTGGRYYRYYCLMCHGEDGRGNTPVGGGYVPKPRDLTEPSVQNKSDGALYRAMVTGKGHEPVLAKTVPPDRRWFIVLHLRSLAGRR